MPAPRDGTGTRHIGRPRRGRPWRPRTTPTIPRRSRTRSARTAASSAPTRAATATNRASSSRRCRSNRTGGARASTATSSTNAGSRTRARASVLWPLRDPNNDEKSSPTCLVGKGGAGNGSSSFRYCKRGHENALCSSCRDDYMFDAVENRCVACAHPPWDVSVSIGKIVSLSR